MAKAIALRRFRLCFRLLLCNFLFLFFTNCEDNSTAESGTQQLDKHPGTFKTIEKRYTNGQLDGYNLYFPPAYEAHVDTSFPLIIFLQGGMAVGGPVNSVLRWELPKELRETTDLNTELNQLKLNTFVYLMPHIAAGEYYHQTEAMTQLLDEILEEYRIDPKRVYLTGLSRGGYGTWGLASKIPERFAAIAPIAGAAHGVRDFEALTQLPIWAAHNLKDDRVDHNRTDRTVRRIEQLIGVPFHRTTTIAEANYAEEDYIFTSGHNPTFEHDAWTEVYNNANFYRWLLRFERE